MDGLRFFKWVRGNLFDTDVLILSDVLSRTYVEILLLDCSYSVNKEEMIVK